MNLLWLQDRKTRALFVVYCFIDGFVARKVAGYFEETYDETSEMV